jgi:hypothetical protein
MEPPPPPRPESYTRDLLARALPLMKDPPFIEAVATYLVTGASNGITIANFRGVYSVNGGSHADWWGLVILSWPALSYCASDPWRSLERYVSTFSR